MCRAAGFRTFDPAGAKAGTTMHHQLAMAFTFASDVGVHLRHDALLSVIWPASGVSLGGLLLFGWRAWPGVLIGGLMVGDSDAVTGWASAGVHVGQTLTPLAAAALLTT